MHREVMEAIMEAEEGKKTLAAHGSVQTGRPLSKYWLEEQVK